MRRRIDGEPRWSPVFKDRASATSWDGHEAKAQEAVRVIRRQGPTFGEVAKEWWALVEAGRYARRRGRAKQLSQTTIADYRRILFGGAVKEHPGSEVEAVALMKRCGRRPIAALDEAYWQSLVDELVRRGTSYSRIATYLAVVRHVYAFARRANRRVIPTDPTRELVMPANDGKPRQRVATREEAAKLVEAIPRIQTTAALGWTRC